MTKQKVVLTKVKKLYDLFQSGKIPTLEIHEVHPNLEKGSRENYLYFTLAPSLNFQRSSPALWLSANKTYEDLKTQYLFFPEEVVDKPREKIQQDLIKHKLGLQPNKHTDIWMTLSKSLFEQFKADPREVLKTGEMDVVKILNLIQKEKRTYFPYLSGPKMANYWLYILTCYTDVKLTNIEQLSIIPDTHVAQSSVQLGLVDKIEPPEVLEKTWKELLKGSGISPVQMHPVLWNWSRNNFLPAV